MSHTVVQLNMIIRGENSESLPIDLIAEILSRLPAKSVARFRCVSKQWGSMLLRPYFTKLFLTRSSARPPRLLFFVQRSDDWCFFTSPQPHDPYDKSSSSLVVAAEFHMKFPVDRWLEFRGRVSGLIFFCLSRHSSEEDKRIAILNPSTGQFASLLLPKRRPRSDWIPFLGFDPIDKQFKVLSIGLNKKPDRIVTLGTGKYSWRKIHCPLIHFAIGEGICINGVLYYLAEQTRLPNYLIVCFDVRSEKFKFIYRDFISELQQVKFGNSKLINYKGRLGVISRKYEYPVGSGSLKMCMWVIEDVEKPESQCPKYFTICLDDDDFLGEFCFSIAGVTATGEIVLSPGKRNVLFINPERNTVQSVEIQGISGRAQVFVDHVEDLRFITKMKTRHAATSISPQGGRTFESINKFDSLRLLDDDDDDDELT